MCSQLSDPLIAWYQDQARELPWRNNSNPYAIWVSEIMLQQTRVDTVIPYYQRWMQRFPEVVDLAEASLHEVLVMWEGLGYYQRGRNLHRAASIILTEYGGELPHDLNNLKKLPGIGEYTAGAIASIAFGMDIPVLDGNIRRVLARIYNITEPVKSPQVENRLLDLAMADLPKRRAGVYNQALMDLGALICTPRNPSCQSCPINHLCRAYQLGIQAQLPIKLPKLKIPHRNATAAIIFRDDQVLITQRPNKGLLGGLWEFPGGKQLPKEDMKSCLYREIHEEIGIEIAIGDLIGIYQHAYTHYRVTLHAYCCHIVSIEKPQPLRVQDLRWVNISKLDEYPMGKLDRSIATQIQQETSCTS
jgi:A/G-specific adenine glycosylase